VLTLLNQTYKTSFPLLTSPKSAPTIQRAGSPGVREKAHHKGELQ